MNLEHKLFKSLYVHVPFCKEKCPYCDFYSETNFHFKELYTKAILKELSLRNPSFSPFPTVYFGGGTPSVMDIPFFEAVLSRIGQFSEVTVEINPEDVNKEFLFSLRSIGVNRISLGIQSFSDKLLKVLGRRQDSKTNLKALEVAISEFSSVSVDLIYGIPGQKTEDFLKDLSIVTDFPVKHVSLYALTFYEETPFGRAVKKGKISVPEDEIVSEMYYLAVEFLESKGFKQYEISNFSKPGFKSKHNVNYWEMGNYLGIGPSAASFYVNTYFRNVRNLKKYIELLESGKLPVEEEEVFNSNELKKVKLMMGLRLTEGVNLRKLNLENTFEELSEKSDIIKGLLEGSFLVYSPPYLRLGKEGYFVSNRVISELIGELFGGEQ